MVALVDFSNHDFINFFFQPILVTSEIFFYQSQKMYLSTTFNGSTTAMLDEKNDISNTKRVGENNYKKIYGDQIDYVDIQIVDVE